MKFKFRKSFMILASLLTLGTLASCANSEIKTPEDAIIDHFGDRQFRISFDSTNLDTPIADMYYSAKNMPTLPSPTKVGYTFEGWFFDANYTEECVVEDNDLFWKMKNVTLYAKWKVEQIVNNGQYDIEYEANIVEGSLRVGPLVKKFGYYKFPEDIIEHGTYIEKNEHGTFLRIQYDSRTRGPVLGGEEVDGNNFSKLTYTITSSDRDRIDMGLSILDRTSTIHTLYYNIEGLSLADPIVFHVEYYNWKDDLEEKERKQASAFYDVSFNITRFIGFGASFIDPNARLEDGIYTIPTHYASLNKGTSILDAFNPVTSYVTATKGHYKLYKPMNVYNSDIPSITQNEYPLRTTGFSKEFTYFLVDNSKILSKEEEENLKGEYFIPELFDAEHFETVELEFNGETGEYYYVLDLGNTLDKDIIFLGGSCGAMEQMFSFALDYRRLILDYSSMIRVSSWNYEPRLGDYYSFKKEVKMYPGSSLDFKNSNTDFDIYNKNKSSINYTNVFYTKKDDKIKVYDSKITIEPTFDYPLLKDSRFNFQTFDMTMKVFGYNPKTDGTLYSRDYIFNTSGTRYSNSTESKNVNGKTLNIGEKVNLNTLYREKVSNDKERYTFKAYELNDALNVNYNKEVKIDYDFSFNQNIAIEFNSEVEGGFNRTSLVKLVKKEKAKIIINKEFKLNSSGYYESDKKYKLNREILTPEIQYSYYNEGFSTRNLHKDDVIIDNYLTDFTHVTFWSYKDSIYSYHPFFPANELMYDFIMDVDKIRILYQLENQFNEIEPILLELKGIESGTFEIKNNDELLEKGDLYYDGNKRLPVQYQASNSIEITDEESIKKISSKLKLVITDNEVSTNYDLPLDFALIYLKERTVKVKNVLDIYPNIKEEEYAIIYLFYNSNNGDQAIFKAQYNFKIDGKNMNSYNIIDQSKTYFTNQEVKLEVPVVTTNNFLKLSEGFLTCLKKVGNHYVDTTESFNSSLNKITFFDEGTYLVTWNFYFSVDKEGNKIFDTYIEGDYATRLHLSISEEIKITSPNTKIKLTYVTDIHHKFNPEAEELKGYEIETKGEYQYASKIINTEDETYCLSINAYMPTYDKLYRYDDGKGGIIGLQYHRVDNLHLKLNTLNPKLYAKWDNGINVDIYYDIYGEKHYSHTTNKLYKNVNKGYDEYTLFISDAYFVRPKGYALYGWRADDQIFYENVVINGKIQNVKTNFHKGELPAELNIRDKVTLTAIMKKKTIVKYKAYDELGNELKFMKTFDSDYNVFINDKLIDSINKQKYSDLKDVYVTDTSKEFLRYEVYNYVTKEYEVINLDDFTLLEAYASESNEIELRVIFR